MGHAKSMRKFRRARHYCARKDRPHLKFIFVIIKKNRPSNKVPAIRDASRTDSRKCARIPLHLAVWPRGMTLRSTARIPEFNFRSGHLGIVCQMRRRLSRASVANYVARALKYNVQAWEIQRANLVGIPSRLWRYGTTAASDSRSQGWKAESPWSHLHMTCSSLTPMSAPHSHLQ